MKPVASEAPGARAPGTRLLRAGVIAFAAVVVSWLVFDAALNGALNVVDLTVYRDGGLIVRHVAPYYDPDAYAPLYDWGGLQRAGAQVHLHAVRRDRLRAGLVPAVGALLVAVGRREHGRAGGGAVVHLRRPRLPDRRVRLGATLLAAAVTFWLQPVVRTIYLGQVNLILMAAIMWDLCQPDAHRARQAPLVEGRAHRRRGRHQAGAAGLRPVPADHPQVPGGGRDRGRLRRHRRRRVRRAAARLVPVVAARHVPRRRQPDRVHGLGGQPVAARDHHPVRRVRRGRRQDPWIVAAVRRARPRHLTAAYLLDRAGLPGARAARDGADRPARLPGQLGPPLGVDRPRDRGDRPLRARAPAGAAARGGARWLWALAAGMVVVFGAWPDAMWETRATSASFSLGFLWAQPNTNPIKFASHGDQPQYVEYHWHGFQLLWGNAYILAGVALLLILVGIADNSATWRRRRAACRALRRPRRSPRDVAGAGCVVPWRCRSWRCRSRQGHSPAS